MAYQFTEGWKGFLESGWNPVYMVFGDRLSDPHREGIPVIVKVPVINMYGAPDPESEVVTQAKLGEELEVQAEYGEWSEVRAVYDGYQGFVQSRDLVRGPWPVGEISLVCNLRGGVYQGPKIQSRLLTVLPLGVKVRVYPGESGDWVKVSLPGGEEGYMHRGDLSIDEWRWESLPELRHSLVQTAKRFLGLPYRWGGTSSLGVDCSGLVQHLYALHGIFLPRDAHEQAKYAQTLQVPRDQLLPGDLLFFSKYGHVGMALDHYRFIHATIHLDPVVQVSLVDDPHWKSRIDEVRRLV